MKRLDGWAGVLLATAMSMMVGSLRAAEKPAQKDLARRYGIQVDLKRYPQGGPQQAIQSVVRVIRAGEIEYLLAHLISPGQVDRKLGGDRQAFSRLAAKATPAKVKKMSDALDRHLRKGTWTIRGDLAWARLDGLPGLSLERIGGRWFMHNTPVPVPKRS